MVEISSIFAKIKCAPFPSDTCCKSYCMLYLSTFSSLIYFARNGNGKCFFLLKDTKMLEVFAEKKMLIIFG
jgi:hypothetical protein